MSELTASALVMAREAQDVFLPLTDFLKAAAGLQNEPHRLGPS